MSVTLFASVPQNSTIPVLNTILIFFLFYIIQFIVQWIYVVCNAKKIYFEIYEKWATYPVENCPCDSCFSIKLKWIDMISKIHCWNKKYYFYLTKKVLNKTESSFIFICMWFILADEKILGYPIRKGETSSYDGL